MGGPNLRWRLHRGTAVLWSLLTALTVIALPGVASAQADWWEITSVPQVGVADGQSVVELRFSAVRPADGSPYDGLSVLVEGFEGTVSVDGQSSTEERSAVTGEDGVAVFELSTTMAGEQVLDIRIMEMSARATVRFDAPPSDEPDQSDQSGQSDQPEQPLQPDQPAQPPARDAAPQFTDVPPGHTFADDVAWLATTGITLGRADGTFGLGDPVTRGAMAAFLSRFDGDPAAPLDAPGFPDVPDQHTFATEVAWLASTGITLGRADGTFGVGDPVTRGAMAAFLYRFAGEPEGPFDAPRFADVEAGSTFDTEVAWLASTGITRGRDDGSFGVADPVTRGAMAAFLQRFEEWLTPEPFRLQARAGVTEQTVVALRSPAGSGVGAPREVEVVVDGELATVVEAAAVDWASARGRLMPIVVSLEAGDATPAQVAGSIEVRTEDGSVLGMARPGVVEVQQLGPGVTPDRPADPRPDALEALEGGQLVVAGELVVELEVPADEHQAALDRLAEQVDGVVVGSVPELALYQLRVAGADTDELSALADQLSTDAQVRFAGLHPVADPSLRTTPNDPWRAPWWDLPPISWDSASPSGANWGMEALRLPQAWSLHTGSPDVPVAVIDVGFFDGHSDLRANVTEVRGHAGAGNRTHGTHVAGTVCAAGDNGVGVTGVAWRCDLRLYNMVPRDDDPLLGLIEEEAPGEDRDQQGLVVGAIRAAEAMLWAVQDGARVVNLSLGFVENFDRCVPVTDRSREMAATTNAVLSTPIRRAKEDGTDVLWVFAAGNECRDARYQSPAGLTERFPDNTLSVAATTRTGRLAEFSNRGSLVDVAAPGTEILSTGRFACTLEGGCSETYATLQGTSMAAPHVSGIAALLLDANPALSAADARRCLIDSAASRTVPGHDFGIVDAEAALRCALGTTAPVRDEQITGVEVELLPATWRYEPRSAHRDPLRARIDEPDRLLLWNFDIDPEVGSTVDAVLNRYETNLNDPLFEDMYGPLPGDWYRPVDVPGADQAVRFEFGSPSGDVTTFAMLVAIADVVLVIELRAHIEFLLEFTEEQIEAVFDSVRVDREQLLTALDAGRGDGAAATRIEHFIPVDTDGRPAEGFTVSASGAQRVLCGPGYPAYDAVGPDIVTCGPNAAGASTCWVAADRTTLYCSRSPWSTTLDLHWADGPLPTIEPRDDPVAFALELVDGRRCYLRTGGSWTGRLDGLAAAYWCERPPGTGDPDGEWQMDPEVVLGAGDGEPFFDRSAPLWTVNTGRLSDTEVLPPPERVGVATLWYAAQP